MESSSTAWFAVQVAELAITAVLLVLVVIAVPLVCRWRKLQFNRLWFPRACIAIASLLWLLSFHLRCEILFRASYGYVPVSVDTQKIMCLSYVASSYGLFEPTFLAMLYVLVAWHAGNQKTSPQTSTLGLSLGLAAPSLAAAAAVIVLNIFPQPTLPSWVYSCYDSGSGLCQTPLLSVGVNVALAAVMVPLFNVMANRVHRLLVNSMQQRRLRIAQITLSIAFSCSAAVRVALPFVSPVLATLILHVAYVLMIVCALFTIGMFVLHPLRTSLLRPLQRRKLFSTASAEPMLDSAAHGSVTSDVEFSDLSTAKEASQRLQSHGSPQATMYRISEEPSPPSTPRDNSSTVLSCTPSVDSSLPPTPSSASQQPPATPSTPQQPRPISMWTPQDPRYRPLHTDNDTVRVSHTPFDVRVERAIQRLQSKESIPITL